MYCFTMSEEVIFCYLFSYVYTESAVFWGWVVPTVCIFIFLSLQLAERLASPVFGFDDPTIPDS